jgi:hypothetical protein
VLEVVATIKQVIDVNPDDADAKVMLAEAEAARLEERCNRDRSMLPLDIPSQLSDRFFSAPSRRTRFE